MNCLTVFDTVGCQLLSLLQLKLMPIVSCEVLADFLVFSINCSCSVMDLYSQLTDVHDR